MMNSSSMWLVAHLRIRWAEVRAAVLPLALTALAAAGVLIVRRIGESDPAPQKPVPVEITHADLFDLVAASTTGSHLRGEVRDGMATALQVLEIGLPTDLACLCRIDNAVCTWWMSRTPACPDPVTGRAGPSHLDLGRSSEELERAAGGHSVHEPSLRPGGSPLAQRLTAAGFAALTVEPLFGAGRVIGLLLLARARPGGFSVDERRLQRRVARHLALELDRATARAALAAASADLAQATRDRPGGLDPTAHAIAHDISNAMSAAGLYCENLLSHESQLSERGRRRLDGISRAIDQAAAGLGRLRQLELKPGVARIEGPRAQDRVREKKRS